jgi:hypothetical protein
MDLYENPETTESKVFKYFLVRSTKTVSGNYTLLYLKVSGLLEYDAIITALTPTERYPTNSYVVYDALLSIDIYVKLFESKIFE